MKMKYEEPIMEIDIYSEDVLDVLFISGEDNWEDDSRDEGWEDWD